MRPRRAVAVRIAVAAASLVAGGARAGQTHTKTVTFEDVLRDATAIVVVKPAARPRTKERVDITPAGSPRNSRRFPPFEFVVHDFEVLKVLKNTGAATFGRRLRVHPAAFDMQLSVHRDTHLRGISKTWISERYEPKVPPPEASTEPLIVFLSQDGRRWSFVADGAVEAAAREAEIAEGLVTPRPSPAPVGSEERYVFHERSVKTADGIGLVTTNGPDPLGEPGRDLETGEYVNTFGLEVRCPDGKKETFEMSSYSSTPFYAEAAGCGRVFVLQKTNDRDLDVLVLRAGAPTTPMTDEEMEALVHARAKADRLAVGPSVSSWPNQIYVFTMPIAQKWAWRIKVGRYTRKVLTQETVPMTPMMRPLGMPYRGPEQVPRRAPRSKAKP